MIGDYPLSTRKEGLKNPQNMEKLFKFEGLQASLQLNEKDFRQDKVNKNNKCVDEEKRGTKEKLLDLVVMSIDDIAWSHLHKNMEWNHI